MKKYWDIDLERIWTEDELLNRYEEAKSDGYIPHITDFADFLRHCMVENNGSLELIADDWAIERVRKAVASDIACDEMPYDECLKVLQTMEAFGNWTAYELERRPINSDVYAEMVARELGVE